MKNKRLLYIILPVLIVALAITGLIFLGLENKDNNSVKASENLKFTVVKETGVVSFKSNESEFQTLEQSELELNSGSFIKTDENSTAFIFLPDNSLITLDPSTEIQVNIEPQKVNIEQFFGNTWHRVQTVQNGGEYNVKTPTTIASVRGTIFSISVDKTTKVTTTMVVESKVEVKGVGMINAGEFGQIDESKNFAKEKISKEIQQTEWFIKNTTIDIEFKQIKEKVKGSDKSTIKEEMMSNLHGNEEYNVMINNNGKDSTKTEGEKEEKKVVEEIFKNEFDRNRRVPEDKEKKDKDGEVQGISTEREQEEKEKKDKEERDRQNNVRPPEPEATRPVEPAPEQTRPTEAQGNEVDTSRPVGRIDLRAQITEEGVKLTWRTRYVRGTNFKIVAQSLEPSRSGFYTEISFDTQIDSYLIPMNQFVVGDISYGFVMCEYDPNTGACGVTSNQASVTLSSDVLGSIVDDSVNTIADAGNGNGNNNSNNSRRNRE